MHPDVFRARFLLRHRPDKLDTTERAGSDVLFAAYLRFKAAWDAFGELHNLYPADDREGAPQALERFADTYGTGQILEFSDVADSFLAWHEQILDWHHIGWPSNSRTQDTN